MDRFWDKVDIRGEDECWEWKGHKHQRGYGIFWHEGKNVRANRMALVLSGQPAPDAAAMSLHSCDNPPCCNPKHLRWGTALDNKNDMILRKGPVHGEGSATATITDAIASEIMRRRVAGHGAPAIAEAMGLSRTLVDNIYSGSAWKHLHGVNGNPTLAELKAARSKVIRVAHNRVITDEMADGIFRARMDGDRIPDIAKRLGIPEGTVSPVFCGLAFADRLGKHGNPTFEELRAVVSMHPRTKLLDEDVSEIRRLLNEGYIGSDIAKRYGVSKATVSNIKRGKDCR